MNDSASPLAQDRAQLAQDLRAVVDDAETLLRHAVRDAGQGYEDARERLQRTLQTARSNLQATEQSLLDRARQAGRATDAYVQRHPWQSIGLGAAVGMLLGILIGRR